MNFSRPKLLNVSKIFQFIQKNPKYLSDFGNGYAGKKFKSLYRGQEGLYRASYVTTSTTELTPTVQTALCPLSHSSFPHIPSNFFPSLRLTAIHPLSQSLRNFSSVPNRTSTQIEKFPKKLYGEEFNVNAGFGHFQANGVIDFVIRPTCPQLYPDADRAFVNIYGGESSSRDGINIELVGEQHDILSITAAPKTRDMYCEVMIPIKYDIEVNLLENANMDIAGMEADEVKISTEEGHIKTGSVKSHNIHINTQQGHITTMGSLQGNIFIHAKKTNFSAKRLQGSVMDIEAEDLNVNVGSCYMSQGQISAKNGDIKLSNLHGCTDLMIKNGNIVLNGFHGQVSGFVRNGSIDAQITDVTGHSTLHVNEGHLSIAILQSPRHNLQVNAPVLNKSEEIQALASDSSSSSPSSSSSSSCSSSFSLTLEDSRASLLKASVKNGSADLKCQDWFSTLNIHTR